MNVGFFLKLPDGGPLGEAFGLPVGEALGLPDGLKLGDALDLLLLPLFLPDLFDFSDLFDFLSDFLSDFRDLS